MIVERTSLYSYPLKSSKFFHPNSRTIIYLTYSRSNRFKQIRSFADALVSKLEIVFLQDLTAFLMHGLVSDRDDRWKGQRETTALRSTLFARPCKRIDKHVSPHRYARLRQPMSLLSNKLSSAWFYEDLCPILQASHLPITNIL